MRGPRRARFVRVRRLLRCIVWRLAVFMYGPPSHDALQQHARDVANGDTAP